MHKFPKRAGAALSHQPSIHPPMAAEDGLETLFRREASTYATRDYLAEYERRRKKAQEDEQQQDEPQVMKAEVTHNSPNESQRKSLAADGSPIVNHGDASTAPSLSSSSKAQQLHRTEDERCRTTVTNWAFTVVDHLNMSRTIVAFMMNYLDRYLAARLDDSRDDCIRVESESFRIFGVVALHLAIKHNAKDDVTPPTVGAILQMSTAEATVEEIEKAESDMLDKLGGYLDPPTAELFAKFFVLRLRKESVGGIGAALKDSRTSVQKAVLDVALYLTELSSTDYFFVSYRPSQVALAAIQNAFDHVAPGERASPWAGLLNNLRGANDSESNDAEALRWCCGRLKMLHAQARVPPTDSTSREALSVIVSPESSNGKKQQDL